MNVIPTERSDEGSLVVCYSRVWFSILFFLIPSKKSLEVTLFLFPTSSIGHPAFYLCLVLDTIHLWRITSTNYVGDTAN